MTRTTLSDGCTLSYKVEGSGPPVVFIQGAGLQGDGWLPQTRELKSNFSCITFDNRGIGQSQPAGAEITVARLAADTLAVMNAEGIDRAHIVGHSLGGAIALEFALTAPGCVASLALLCTSARGSDGTKPTARMIWLGARSRIGTRRMRANAFLEIVLPTEYLVTQDKDALADRLQPLFGHHLGDTPSIVMSQLRALRRFDATGRLSELRGIPTLVLSAERDLIFPPACGLALAAGITGATYVEIPGAAHGVTLQCHETVNRYLRDHFNSACFMPRS